MPLVYPQVPEVETCVLLFIPVELVPIVGGLLSQLEARKRWESAEDWEKGYKAFTSLQDQLMNSCLQTLIAEIRALRGVKPESEATPIEERTTDMYRSFNDIIDVLTPILLAMRGSEPIEDSIIEALRGTTPADETRNIVDQLI